MKRIESLDWLRGLLALSIMVYHLISWEIDRQDASSFLGRMGIYGVSMFFILSGLSMGVVYSNYIVNFRKTANFLIRRTFRILPLMWVAVSFSIIKSLVFGKPIEGWVVFLNLTALFGFFSPAEYLNTGAWSIGNEMVFYAATPLIIFLYNRNIHYGNFLTIFSIFVAFIFSHIIINPEMSINSQHSLYVNPFNNFFLYCCGLAIYYNLSRIEISQIGLFLLFFFSISVFFIYPATGDKINIISGNNRFVFSIASIFLVVFFYKTHLCLPPTINQSLIKLGTITYGVYLLHPIVHEVNMLFLRKMDFAIEWKILFTMLFTLIASLLVYRFIEEPFIRLGKWVTRNKSSSTPFPVQQS